MKISPNAEPDSQCISKKQLGVYQESGRPDVKAIAGPQLALNLGPNGPDSAGLGWGCNTACFSPAPNHLR